MKIARFLPRFRDAYRSFGELENRESWSRAQIEAFQLQRLNKVWSHAIHYVTEQPIELAERGFSILKNISGRCDDLLYTPAGRCLHPTVVEDLFDENYFKYVRRFQIHQRADYSIVASVELNDPANVPNTKQLAKHLSVQVDGCPVEVEIVARIGQTTAGKHRNILSEVDDFDPQSVIAQRRPL